MKVSTVNRFFNILLGALAMVVVAIFSAYIAMRVAIHGREVEVPQLANLPLSEAAAKAAALGLRFNIENRFYSAVPAGEVISQSPAPGATVRREWTVRVTESLGPQQVAIPSFIGQTERPATIAIRRLALELGVVARIPAAGPAGIILAQTPVPSATGTSGIDSPRVSLLLSAPLPATKPNPDPSAPAHPILSGSLENDQEPSAGFVMPSFVGLTLPAAAHLAATAHLHIASAEELAPAPAAPSGAAPSPAGANPAAPNPTNTANALPIPTSNAPAPATPATTNPTTPAPSAATAIHPFAAASVVAQVPAAGQHVYPGDLVKISFAHP